MLISYVKLDRTLYSIKYGNQNGLSWVSVQQV